ncbi:CD209 antigen-like protein D isoform X2 [Mytilus edulis]|uniref:CD209 antigen-like protein D isoform X2 n=1 Tax=Mytilus edulis TaxID=6550 RepID=UPI0039EE99CE
MDAVKTECHIGWLHYGNSCYLFSSTKMSWYNAASSCREHGAQLAEIETQAEDRYITNIAQTLRSFFWLGARDDVVEGTFEWSSGTPFIYTNWHPGEPNNGGPAGSEDCVFTDGGWTDQSCDVKNNYVCEKEYPEELATNAPVVGK